MPSPFTLLLLGLLAAPYTSPPAAIDAAVQDGQSEPSAADRLAALEAAFDQAMVEFTALYQAAQTDEGVIRFKDLRGTELDTAVDRLLA